MQAVGLLGSCLGARPTCYSYMKQENKERPLFSCTGVGFDLSSQLVSKQVFSALQSLTSVFGMGTGGPSALKVLTNNGAPSGIRTRDPLIKSQLLYQLS